MQNASYNQVIADLAQDTLQEVASEDSKWKGELPYFKARSEAYFQNPQKTIAASEARNTPAGAGTGVIEIPLTIILLWLGQKLLDAAWEVVSDPIKEKAKTKIAQFIESLLSKFRSEPSPQPATLPAVTIAQREAVRARVLANLEEFSGGSIHNEEVLSYLERMIEKLPLPQ